MPQPQSDSMGGSIARDLLALGSWVFYLLILGRAMIAPYRPFTDQMIVAGILLLAAGWLWRKWDGYIGRSVVLAVLVIVFYESWTFAVFVVAAMVALMISAVYLERGTRRIVAGAVVGLVCTAAAWAIGAQTREWVLPDIGRGPAHLEPEGEQGSAVRIG